MMSLRAIAMALASSWLAPDPLPCNISPRFRAGAERHRASLRDFDLGGAKPILPEGRSVRCSLLNQQAFRLEKEFEADHRFHRAPLVPGCLEALQYVSPGVVRSIQCHLLNKSYGLCCAAQYYWRARADTQLRINWEVRHEHLTPVPLPKFHPRSTFVWAQERPLAAACSSTPRRPLPLTACWCRPASGSSPEMASGTLHTQVAAASLRACRQPEEGGDRAICSWAAAAGWTSRTSTCLLPFSTMLSTRNELGMELENWVRRSEIMRRSFSATAASTCKISGSTSRPNSTVKDARISFAPLPLRRRHCGRFIIQRRVLPFSLMTSTPLIVALSLPSPAGTKVRSVRRHGRSLVTATHPGPSPLPLPASLLAPLGS